MKLTPIERAAMLGSFLKADAKQLNDARGLETTKIRLNEFGLLPRRIRLQLKTRQESSAITPQVETRFARVISPSTVSDDVDVRDSKLSTTNHPSSYSNRYNFDIVDAWNDSIYEALREIAESVAKLPEKDRTVRARILWKEWQKLNKKPKVVDQMERFYSVVKDFCGTGAKQVGLFKNMP